MLSLPPSVRIHLARGATDMRKSIDGLVAVTKHVLAADPFSGHLFVFCNRARDRVKWEGSGFWLLHKRLEHGTFAWPVPATHPTASIELKQVELSALLGGLDIRTAKKRRWYSRTA